MPQEVVQRNQTSFDNRAGDAPAPEQNFEQTVTTEGQQPATPPADGGGENTPPATPPEGSTEGQPEGGAAEPDSAEKFAEALLQRLGQVQQQPGQQPQQPQQPELSFEDQVAQQREQVTTGLQEQVAGIVEQQTALQQKLETGDVDMQTYMVQREALNEQKWEAQRAADAQLLKVDNDLARYQERQESEAMNARAQYAQENPDFVEMYSSGQLQQVLSDPKLSPVLGGSPAAAHQYLKSQALQSENEQLKAQLAQAQQTQQQAISAAAQNPHQKVGTTGGGNAPTPPPRGDSNNPTDSMMAALQRTRQSV